MDFGLGISPVDTVEKIARFANTVEEKGFTAFVHADQRLRGERDAFVTLTADALSTKKIKLGTCISDPFSRIPAMLASAIASLDELSGNRAVLTLGSGGAGFEELHIIRKHPNTALREAVHIIRGLFQGEEVSFHGKIFEVTKAKLNFECRSDLPIQIASRSPLNLELAGEVADGVVIATYASASHLKFALRTVETGAKRANRSLDEIKKIAWLYMSISENTNEALNNVRPIVTQALVNTSPAMNDVMFEGIDPNLRRFIETCQRDHDLQKAYDDRRYITNDVIEKFSLAGSVDQIVEKIERIKKLGIDAIWIRPFSAPYSETNHEKVVTHFAEKVMPRIK
ncbi:MAG: LLM class flavin-dependent oxidoreductase [Nitrososphaerales archaeon]